MPAHIPVSLYLCVYMQKYMPVFALMFKLRL